MISLKYHPPQLTAPMLDALLEKGWFRMGQSVFITHYLRFREQFFCAVWLRYRLDSALVPGLDAKLRKVRSRFTIETGPWQITPGQEELFTLYRQHSGLAMAGSLHQVLLDEGAGNIFPTLQVTLRDGDRLAGLGIFDMGLGSAAGISNIYHPAYSRYSPGKMLMLLKMVYCISHGVQWFYPGYAVPGYSRFDYKLQVLPHHTQYYHGPGAEWRTYSPQTGLPDYWQQLTGGLTLLWQQYQQQGRQAMMVYYPPFDIALVNDLVQEVVTTPAFLMLSYQPDPEAATIVMFDLASGKYAVAGCMPLYKNGWNTEEGLLLCYDVLQVVESTGFLFSAGEILKITTAL